MKKILMLALLVACGRPEPLERGSCAPTAYDDKGVVRSRCLYLGYSWDCSRKRCDRGAPLVLELDQHRPSLPG